MEFARKAPGSKKNGNMGRFDINPSEDDDEPIEDEFKDEEPCKISYFL